jgi:ankyrin repeat protein
VRLDTVEYFIREVGSNINHEDVKHETPMIIAKRTGKKQLVQLLLSNGAKALEEIRK